MKKLSIEAAKLAKQRRKYQTKLWATNNKERMKELSRQSETRNYEDRQEYKKAYYQAHKEKIKIITRRNKLLRKYGMTLKQYADMLKRQNHCCAICNTPSPGTDNSNFRIDHNHYTGKVRGLLCHKCNAGIGLLGDCLSRLEVAVIYLKKAESDNE